MLMCPVFWLFNNKKNSELDHLLILSIFTIVKSLQLGPEMNVSGLTIQNFWKGTCT